MRSSSTTIAAAFLSFSLFCHGAALADMSGTTDEKLYRLELEPEPEQPVVGTNAAVLTVADAQSNRPVDDATIEVVPWMTVHGHGSPKNPVIRQSGAGRYRVENLFYTMEGDWDLIITIRSKGARDTGTIPVRNVKRK